MTTPCSLLGEVTEPPPAIAAPTMRLFASLRTMTELYPLMHTNGSNRATLRAKPAASAASTTADTSL